MTKTTAPGKTPSPAGTAKPHSAVGDPTKSPTAIFIGAALDMSWRLAIVVLVPIILGAELDRAAGVSYLLFIGLALALVGTVLVMWKSVQAANRLPVPKLTAAQRQAIRKSYEAEDD
jgi:hypothetical protein